jgi:hypothetical protein
VCVCVLCADKRVKQGISGESAGFIRRLSNYADLAFLRVFGLSFQPWHIPGYTHTHNTHTHTHTQDASLADQLQQWLTVLALGVADHALAHYVWQHTQHARHAQHAQQGAEDSLGDGEAAEGVGSAARVAVCVCLLLGTHQVCMCVRACVCFCMCVCVCMPPPWHHDTLSHVTLQH